MRLAKQNLGKVSVTIEKAYHSVDKEYDKLVVVEEEGQFRTFISRKPVPIGTELTDREFWLPFSSVKESIVIDYNKFKQYIRTGEGLLDDSIVTRHIKNRNITGDKIAEETITFVNIANEAITLPKINKEAIDTTLTKEGYLAEAKHTGERLLNVEGLAVVKVLSTQSTVLDAWQIIDKKGNVHGVTINTYKDKSIDAIWLSINEDDPKPEDLEVKVDNPRYLNIVYNKSDGTKQKVSIPLSSFVTEAEFSKNGFKVIDGIVNLKISSDITTSRYLHFDIDGNLTLDGFEERILEDLGTFEHSESGDGTMWGEFKKQEAVREEVSNSAHTVFSDNWDEQDDDPEEYDPLAVVESSYAYNWKSTDTPANDGKTQGNLKDLYNKTLDTNKKLSELEVNTEKEFKDFGIKSRTKQLFNKEDYGILKGAYVRGNGELIITGEMSFVIIPCECEKNAQYNFKFFQNDGNMFCKGIFAFKNYPSVGQVKGTDFIQGTHAIGGGENRGFITTDSTSDYKYIVLWLDDKYYEKTELIESICLVQSNNYPIEPSELLPYIKQVSPEKWVDKYVTTKSIGAISKQQGAENAGKVLVVKQDGIVGLGESGGSVDLSSVVKYTEILNIPIGNNIVTVAPTNESWSYSNGVYTHIGGTTSLVFSNTPTVSGKKYVTRLILGSSKDHSVSVSVGEKPKVSAYNNTTTAIIGFVSDGGHLKITPDGNYQSTVKVELYEVVDESLAAEHILFTCDNVLVTSSEKAITNWWNVVIGTKRTFMNAESATRCIAIGNEALHNFITGTRNIAIGTFAAQSIINGDENIAIGSDSLYGENASYPLIYADRCIAIGKKSMGGRSKNIESVAVGNYAMMSDNVSHIESTAVGRGAAQMNTDGIIEVRENTSVGYLANFYANSGNTSIGAYAAYQTKGIDNVAIGKRSYQQNSGNYNTFVGAGSGCMSNVNDSIAIGYNTKATKSNQMILGSSNITEVVIMGNKKLIFNSDGTITWEQI